MNEQWKQQILQELSDLRRNLAAKADKSTVEQISRQQEELISKRNPKKEGYENKTLNDPERVCLECIEHDDYETAFLTVLRHIESISATKAESKSVEEKASRSYVESLFDRLNILHRQQISESNEQLRTALESRLNSLTDQFDDFANKITIRIEQCENEVNEIDDFINTNLNKYLVTKPKTTAPKPVSIITESTTQKQTRSRVPSRIKPGRWSARSLPSDNLSSSVTVTVNGKSFLPI